MDRLGGGERYTEESFRCVERSFDTCVGYAIQGQPSSSLDLHERLDQQFLSFDACGLSLTSRNISFRQLLIEAAQFDIVWVHQYLASPMIFDILTNADSNQRLILSTEGYEPERDRFREYFQSFQNVSIIEISAFAATLSAYFGPQAQFVSGGIWREDLAPLDVFTSKIPRQICTVARILPHKGIEVTLAAIPKDCSFKVVGPSNRDAVYLEYLSTIQTDAIYELVGEVTEPIKRQILWDSELLIASSTEMLYDGGVMFQAELLGLVILEAVAAGALPIVSDTPAFVEVMTNLGLTQYVYPRRESARLRELIVNALGMDSTERRDIVVAAQSELQKRYLWNDYWSRVKEAAGLALSTASP